MEYEHNNKTNDGNARMLEQCSRKERAGILESSQR